MGLSAKRIGERIGLNAEQTNVLLKDEGYHEGEPGYYIPTEKGKKFLSEGYSWDNGYGGYAHRAYDGNTWDKSIIDKLDTSSENLERIRKLTTQSREERRIKKEELIKKHEQELVYNQNNDVADNNANVVVVIAGIVFVATLGGIGIALYKHFKKKKQKENLKNSNN